MDGETWRVVDANANRAAEGLRTLEDVARLVREDRRSAAEIKRLRHRLGEVLASLPRTERLAARSTADDAGTANSHALETRRENLGDIVAAAVERTTQALRMLEEFGKRIDPETAENFKQLRYQAYDDLARIELRWSTHAWLRDLRLCLLIDCELPLPAFSDTISGLCDSGLQCVQLRDKRASERRLIEYGRAAIEVLNRVDGHLIVNDRVDVALACGAAGVHVGQDDLSVAEVRSIAGGRLAIGLSTHNLEQALTAEQVGADYIGCGPCFPSRTKNFEHFPGMDFLKQVAQAVHIPALAIGGIGVENVAQVIQAGIARVAVSAAVHQAADPRRALSDLLRQLNAGS